MTKVMPVALALIGAGALYGMYCYYLKKKEEEGLLPALTEEETLEVL
jgi:hypothetical protein